MVIKFHVYDNFNIMYLNFSSRCNRSGVVSTRNPIDLCSHIQCNNVIAIMIEQFGTS